MPFKYLSPSYISVTRRDTFRARDLEIGGYAGRGIAGDRASGAGSGLERGAARKSRDWAGNAPRTILGAGNGLEMGS